MLIMPYFLENEDWYEISDGERRYKLTDKAPPKAVKSYNKFYDKLENNVYEDENGDFIVIYY